MVDELHMHISLSQPPAQACSDVLSLEGASASGGAVCKCLKMGEARTSGTTWILERGPGIGRRLLKRSIFSLLSCNPAESRRQHAPDFPSITGERLLIKEGSARSCLEIADEVKLSCEREQFSISSFRLLLRAKMKGSVILHVFDIQIFEIMPGFESLAIRYELLEGELPFTSFSATQTICMRNEWIEY